MKKKARPASAKKTVKKSPAKKPATKKKVATKGLKKSKGNQRNRLKGDTEYQPGDVLPRDSNDYVNVFSSRLISNNTQLELTLEARNAGDIDSFGCRLEDKNGDPLELAFEPAPGAANKKTFYFNLPAIHKLGALAVSDYSVVILTKKKITP
jgi:hypothetical protein